MIVFLSRAHLVFNAKKKSLSITHFISVPFLSVLFLFLVEKIMYIENMYFRK